MQQKSRKEQQMRLVDAQSVIRQVSGKQYSWLVAWGLSIIREAIRTICNRKSSTDADLERAEDVERVIYRKW